MSGGEILAVAAIVLGVIAELMRRKWAAADQRKADEKEFQRKRDEAIANDDIYNRYNR